MEKKRDVIPQISRLRCGSRLLFSHVDCVLQIEKEGFWLLKEVDIDEGAVVAIFSERNIDPYLDRPRGPAL